jgi:hypothetical protein
VKTVYRVEAPDRGDLIFEGAGTPPCNAPEEPSTLVPLR